MPSSESIIYSIYPEFEEYKDDTEIFVIHHTHDQETLEVELKTVLEKKKYLILFYGETLLPVILRNISEVVDKVTNNTTDKNRIFLFLSSVNAEMVDVYNEWFANNKFVYPLKLILASTFEREVIQNKAPISFEHRPKKFLCLNRQARPHRLEVIHELYKRNLIDHGKVSFWKTPKIDTYSDYTEDGYNKILELLETVERHQHKWPLLLDVDDLDKNNPLMRDFDAFKLHTQTYFSIVTETYFYNAQDIDPKWDWEDNYWFNNTARPRIFKGDIFFSEKIFKPIYYKQPFILVSTPGSLKKLREFGYWTFDKWIDESYDEEQDFNKRMKMIMDEVERLTHLSDDEWVKLIHDMYAVLDFNYRHYISYCYDRRITKDAIKYFKDTQ